MSDMLERVTGSTGDAIADGATRALLTAGIMGLANFVSLKFDWLTAQDLSVLDPVFVAFAFLGAGLYDKFIKA